MDIHSIVDVTVVHASAVCFIYEYCVYVPFCVAGEHTVLSMP